MTTRVAIHQAISIELFVIDCASCGMLFGITREFEDRQRANHRTFYCPSGHSRMRIIWASEPDAIIAVAPSDFPHRMMLDLPWKPAAEGRLYEGFFGICSDCLVVALGWMRGDRPVLACHRCGRGTTPSALLRPEVR